MPKSKAGRSWRLVIDASVLRAAGDAPGGSRACRDLLRAVLEICHRAVLSDALKAEWHRNQSQFALKWRVEMNGRKKIDRIGEPGNLTHLLAGIAQHISDESTRHAAQKDAHLVAAALEADHAVVSCDEQARAVFRELSDDDKRLRKLVWVNPAKLDESVVDWLENGSLDDPARLLHPESD